MPGGTPAPAVDILGHLFLPKGAEKVPAVILVHGSWRHLQCDDRLLAQAVQRRRVRRIKGAHHKFDGDDTRLLKLATVVTTTPNCPYEFDLDGFAVVDRTNGQRLPADAVQGILKKCSGRGASIQGNKAARDEASKAAITFLRKVFTTTN